MRSLCTLSILAVVAVLWPRPAAAYLDANTGSLLLQVLLGGVAGLALVGKLFWHRITSVLGLQKNEDDPEAQ